MSEVLTLAKLTSNPSQTGWSQVHEFTPGDKEKRVLRGRLVAILAVSLADDDLVGGIKAVTVGREILTRLHEEYFGKLEGSVFDTLGKAVKTVVEEFGGQGKVEIVAAVFLKGAVYLAAAGGAQAFLFRQGSLINLVGKDNGPAVVSGKSLPQDVFLLGSGSFFKKFSLGVIKASLATPINQARDQLASSIYADGKNGKMAAVLVAFDGQQVTEKIPVQKLKKKKIFPRVPKWNRLGEIIDRFVAKLPPKKLVVRSDITDLEEIKKKKVAATVGVALLALLMVSIGFGVRQRIVRQEKQKYEVRIAQASHEIEEAESLATINPARARELILSAKGIVDGLKEEGVVDSQLSELEERLVAKMGEVAGIYESEPDMFLDLALITSGFAGEAIDLSDERMLVLDKAGKRLVSVGLMTKKTQVVAGPEELSSPQTLAIYADRNFVLDNFGISEVNEDIELMVKNDWEGEVLIKAYTGNLYVLEKTAGKIWRYPGIGSNFGEGVEWFAIGTTPDLSDSLSWVIDGLIWVLKPGGRILKFSLGSQQNFSVSGVDKTLDEVTLIYTNDEADYLYLLDPANSRVVVIDKEGLYKAQYLSEKIKEVKGLVVSESQKKIILLTSDKLYSIEIKHLE